LEEQRRIAAILDAADELRTKRRLALAKLDTLTQAIFIDMFGDPSGHDGGRWAELAELVRHDDKINYGVVQPGDPVECGRPLIRVGDLVDGQVDHTAIKLISPEIDAQYSRSKLRGDEILLSCVGSTGTVALASEGESGWNIARAVARIPLAEDVCRDYIAAFLRSSQVQRYFQNELRTVGQPTLNIKQIKETPVRVPPLPDQQRFAARLGNIEKSRAKQRSSAKSITSLFASLQQRAFRGEL